MGMTKRRGPQKSISAGCGTRPSSASIAMTGGEYSAKLMRWLCSGGALVAQERLPRQSDCARLRPQPGRTSFSNSQLHRTATRMKAGKRRASDPLLFILDRVSKEIWNECPPCSRNAHRARTSQPVGRKQGGRRSAGSTLYPSLNEAEIRCVALAPSRPSLACSRTVGDLADGMRSGRFQRLLPRL
jgi:hypothetical protein